MIGLRAISDTTATIILVFIWVVVMAIAIHQKSREE